jgi:ribose 5-phosphate isomerase A
MAQDGNKRRAAVAALDYIEQGDVLGVGTGSTVEHFIAELPRQATRVAGIVSSSEQTTGRLRALDLRVSELESFGGIDLYVDGADEATARLHLTKGGGGALTREKVLAAAARRFVCIIDDTKLVETLGRFPLPVEVIPMAKTVVAAEIAECGGRPVWREGFVTDNGNGILDVHDLEIDDPVEMESRLNQIPGVVTVGLFARRGADVLLVGGDEGVRVIE